jgi:hypothetical protein
MGIDGLLDSVSTTPSVERAIGVRAPLGGGGGGAGAIILAQAERLIAAATAAKLVIQERFIGLPRFASGLSRRLFGPIPLGRITRASAAHNWLARFFIG